MRAAHASGATWPPPALRRHQPLRRTAPVLKREPESGGNMQDRTTISEAYRAQQQQLHENPNYGVASLSFAPIVKQVFQNSGARSLSDYGAGKQNLLKGLQQQGVTDFEYFPYDPAFPEYGEPKPADLVTCIDVLEHIEEDYLENVLADLSGIVRKLGFFTIHTGPAGKVLSDGRNAHLIQKPSSWWLPRLCQYFEIIQLSRVPGGFWIVVEPKRG